MRKDKRLFWALAFAGLAALYSGCAKRTGRIVPLTRNAEGQEVYRLKTWSRLDCSAAPFIVGDRLGFFKEAGVEMVYTGEISSPQRIPSIMSGDNDMFDGHPNTLAIARHGGALLRGVATGGVEPDYSVTDPHLLHMWWVSNKNGRIKTLEDVRNFPGKVKMQSISRNTCTEFMTDIWLDKLGIPKDKIDFILLPDVEGVLSLKQGLVDIATPHPPFYRPIEQTGIANVLITSREIAGLDAGTGMWSFTDEFIKNNPEAVGRFVRAIKNAERWANDHPEETSRMTEEAIGVPVLANHYYSRTPIIDEAGIQVWIDGSIRSGALPPDTKIAAGDILTHDFEHYGLETPALALR
ncbi:ABC transporter substrate-binding protein [Treponema endosymbiont of Eucomonympha sp.]|uniref:ABC transporter substrate-binding protein n=1 Tax=Treponema endosymbiont of Eucomonympha sp. TaxID=1580831 RepID=UPI0007517EC5|nr:ABC transporter substrate-binding protein [Treponema endosymbiont of Eucomonympha sp.]